MNPFLLYSNMTLIDFDAYVLRVYELFEQKAKKQENEMNGRKNSGKVFPHLIMKMN